MPRNLGSLSQEHSEIVDEYLGSLGQGFIGKSEEIVMKYELCNSSIHCFISRLGR